MLSQRAAGLVSLEDVASALAGEKMLGDVYVAVGSKQGVARLPSEVLIRARGWNRTRHARLTVYQAVGPRRVPRRDSRSSAVP
jgi:hypothetical protein